MQHDFLQRYSLKRRADEQLHLLIGSVRAHAASNSKIALFGRFTGLAAPLPHAAFLCYLRLLSGVEAELGRSLGAEWLGSPAQPLLLLLEQGQRALASAFGEVLPPEARARLAHDLALLAREPTEAGAVCVELDQLLQLGVDSFMEEHTRTSAFLEVAPRPIPIPHAPSLTPHPPVGACARRHPPALPRHGAHLTHLAHCRPPSLLPTRAAARRHPR